MERQTVTLGRTGLTVTVAGLGCGGFSRLGLARGLSHAADVVRCAWDCGITLFDTAHSYGTEPAVRQGLLGVPRDRYVLSSKFLASHHGIRNTPHQMRQGIQESLRALGADYIDIYYIHALTPKDVEYARSELYPILQQAREQGKIRFTAVSELFENDPTHIALQTVLADDFFDVVMVGYNLLNPSAARTVFPKARERNVGVVDMFAVRNAFSNTDRLAEILQTIQQSGQGGRDLKAGTSVLDFLKSPGAAETLPEAAYRFCRHTKGVDVVLTGTGNTEHLKSNIKSIEAPPLPEQVLQRLSALFGDVDCVSGQ